ncbi:hypothetical protein FSB73_15420 [Arachidicoccus ginsenosidivorans]|uniref:Porin n=2 Tax=Arachidicoccus ginsenosidivorans TaxID=496057 RepID=A0A5B8VMR0_9BACT|nr:hypothetical protein FSB73_15420 [Arachidicoccus ginsenosidivorans]
MQINKYRRNEVSPLLCKTVPIIVMAWILVMITGTLRAQVTDENQTYQTDNQGRPIAPNQGGNDSLKMRDKFEDSITISYRYFDSTLDHHMDSSINDFNTRLQLPYTYNDLGNIGSPAQSLLFKPYMKPGWDEGMHSMDYARFTLKNTRYFTSTRPYSELGYMLGGKGEQYIDLLHTQNRNRNVNFTFEYRLLNAPGSFKNQNDANSNLRANISVKSTNKRYSSNLIFIRNSLKTATNGGLVDPDQLKDLSLGDPFQAGVKLGNSNTSTSNPFNATVVTGNTFTDVSLYLRQSFDFGQKDSVVQDTVTYYQFYPRLRLEHAISYTTHGYNYHDYNPTSDDYLNYYNFIVPTDTILFEDKWKDLTNQFAIYTYPDKKNKNQFLKLHGDLQMLNGRLGDNYKINYNNIFVGAEYRNRSKNEKWNIQLAGNFYLAGNYSGDYNVQGSLRRDFGEKLGGLELGFMNVNRTPSFIYNAGNEGAFTTDTSKVSYHAHSDFPVIGVSDLNKENISRAYASYYLPALGLSLTGNYYFVSNYTYFKDIFTAAQSSSLFNVLQVGAQKHTRLGKFFHWYLDANVQQRAGEAPLNLPLLILRNRIAFEGHFYNNLYLSTGIDIRYVSPYKADSYSPFTGQFYYQDQTRISNRPDISFYINFRIKRFRFFGELANLNTMDYSNNTFGFNHYNYVNPNMPGQALWLRMGVWWYFIN